MLGVIAITLWSATSNTYSLPFTLCKPMPTDKSVIYIMESKPLSSVVLQSLV